MGSGVIKTLTDRGFGFIGREGEAKDLFFHSNELRGVSFDELREGDLIGFDIVVGPKGPSAINVARNGIPDNAEANAQKQEEEGDDPNTIIRSAVKIFCSRMAHAIAINPEILEELEWRDLERLIAEVFSGLGFDVELTPGSKDGGKDVIVNYSEPGGEKKSYFVEIKHWRSGKRVRSKTVMEFLHVIARENKTGGILLATHGFASESIEMLTEIDRQTIALGTEKKVVSLCRAYVKARKGIWYPPDDLEEVVFEETI